MPNNQLKYGVKMLKDTQGSDDGINLKMYRKGVEYEVGETLYKNFMNDGVIELSVGEKKEVAAKQQDAENAALAAIPDATPAGSDKQGDGATINELDESNFDANTKTQIVEWLTEKGATFDPKAKKTDLVELATEIATAPTEGS